MRPILLSGAALQQWVQDSWQPMAFFSKRLQPAEEKYSTFGRELLAIYLAVRHFRYQLEGRPFTIYTDHKPLTFALKTRSDRFSPREQRHLAFVAEFTSDIQHISGSDNQVADALSRPSVYALQRPIDFSQFATAQASCPVLAQLRSQPQPSSQLVWSTVNVPFSPVPLICDISTGTARPYVPADFRRPVFESLHNISHPGIRATQRLIVSRYVWPDINKDVRLWTRQCHACQLAKVHRHTSMPLSRFIPPDHRFDHIHIDLVGPLPPSNGHTYLLTAVDRFTRWPEVYPLSDCTAESVAQGLLHCWVSRFGAPSIISTDRGKQFESALFGALMKFLGCTRIRTAAYHPQANGLVERFHRHLKASLMATGRRDWFHALPMVLLGIRAAFRSDLDCSVAELTYGTSLRLPGEFYEPAFTTAPDPSHYVQYHRTAMKDLHPCEPRHGQRPIWISGDLQTCSHVYVRTDSVRKPLQPPFSGPYRALTRHNKFYSVDIKGKPDNVSLDRLKPAYLANPNVVSLTQSHSVCFLATPPRSPSPCSPLCSVSFV